ncbi:hypothetical protein GCM10009817_35220 [Terrabacter lapilli]|uniref:UDP-N-acetylmuramyl pentapeptide phosphotransferase/UDP-N-acetylglucosamine-1-phosphate transferase n=1 Tax=Terrabacter lapilli TaxID=436231 RepID=A0ABN2SPB8_9MICO
MTSPRSRARTAAASSLVAAALATGGSWGLLRLSRRLPAAARGPWERVNHAGRAVTLLQGPAWVGGAVLGAAAAGALGREPGRRPGTTAGGSGWARTATTLVAVGAGALGAFDDLAGGGADKGLRGHLGALARGEVTTGAVKIVGLGACGVLGVAVRDLATARTDDAAGARPSGIRPLSVLVGGAVVAGAANVVNLFDLRPGRALKVTIASGLPLAGTTAGAAAVGSSLGLLRADLQATSMLGDTGANAAGALLGLALVERTGLAGRAVALAALAALTLASERVSFTKVIEGNAVLRRVDEWGREVR